jgi:hypothetical protein
MKKRTEIDPVFYEVNSFADAFAQAERSGELLRPHGGKNAIEVMKEHIFARKKSETVSMRLPKPLIAAIKQQAERASVPWTTYMREVLETGVCRIAKEMNGRESAAWMVQDPHPVPEWNIKTPKTAQSDDCPAKQGAQSKRSRR